MFDYFAPPPVNLNIASPLAAACAATATLSPVIEYVAPAPTVFHAPTAPVIKYVAHALADTYPAPAPVIEYVAPAPAVTCVAPAPPAQKIIMGGYAKKISHVQGAQCLSLHRSLWDC